MPQDVQAVGTIMYAELKCLDAQRMHEDKAQRTASLDERKHRRTGSFSSRTTEGLARSLVAYGKLRVLQAEPVIFAGRNFRLAWKVLKRQLGRHKAPK